MEDKTLKRIEIDIEKVEVESCSITQDNQDSLIEKLRIKHQMKLEKRIFTTKVIKKALQRAGPGGWVQLLFPTKETLIQWMETNSDKGTWECKLLILPSSIITTTTTVTPDHSKKKLQIAVGTLETGAESFFSWEIC